MSSILQTLMQRRSVRAYLDIPVPEALLEQLLQAAMAAPTACNSQPWEFIVITEGEVLDALRARLRFAPYNAPAAIVVCGNPGIAHNSAGKRYWEQDCSAAMQNILIAATGLGLGSVWIGIHPLPSMIAPVRTILAIPGDVIPLGMAYIGYPAESPPARTQYDPHRVYWQRYESRKRRAKVKNAKYLP